MAAAVQPTIFCPALSIEGWQAGGYKQGHPQGKFQPVHRELAINCLMYDQLKYVSSCKVQ